MKRLFVSTALLLALVATVGYSVDVSIQFANRRIYHPGSDVEIRVTISNSSAEPYRFKLADRRLFSVDFDVRTLTNTVVTRSAQFTTRRGADQAVFYREVTIEPGEEYSFVEPLDQYVAIPGPGTYVISGRFYPELWSRSGSEETGTNRLTLTVRPSPEGVPEVAARIVEETEEILVREALAPDEVVRGTIEARIRSQWNRFFLYMDVESILRLNPTRERRFQALGEADQHAEIEQFRAQLQSDRIDEDIATIPDEFEIVETRYTRTNATVITEQRFSFPTFTEVKEYTYRLERRDDVWVIYDYSVENIGTI